MGIVFVILAEILSVLLLIIGVLMLTGKEVNRKLNIYLGMIVMIIAAMGIIVSMSLV